MNDQWHVVCLAAHLNQYTGVCVLVEGHQIALFSVEDKIYALDEFDPFSQAHVISRSRVCYLNERPVLASPVYQQHFDLETGLCCEDPSLRIHVYPVKTLFGQVEVMVDY